MPCNKNNEKKKPQIKMSYSSPRWTAEIADCSLPMTLDTYSNCSFGCVYCFAQYQRGVGASKEKYLAKKVECVNPEKVIKIMKGEVDSQFKEFVKTGRPIQYGGLSDQFDGFERKYGITYEVLKELKKMNYPICFSTKSAWVFHDEKYRELFRGQDNWNMKFSIITLDEENAKKIEVGVPTPRERLEAMREYTKLNKGGATLRLRPFIIGVSSKDYKELIREAHKHGATAVTTEFFCMEVRSTTARDNYKVISECAGFDIFEFYKKYSTAKGYLRLNRKIKEKYVKEMKELCDELGMRFYVSDAHFKESCSNSCCCGLPPEWEYSRGNFAYALEIAKQKGEVRWSDIEHDMYFLEDFEFRVAQGFNTGSTSTRAKYNGMSMKDYLRYLWNNPKMGQSPYKIFEKALVPNGYDEDKNIIYKYNENVSFIKLGGCSGNCNSRC